jgi:hypothetical protein
MCGVVKSEKPEGLKLLQNKYIIPVFRNPERVNFISSTRDSDDVFHIFYNNTNYLDLIFTTPQITKEPKK